MLFFGVNPEGGMTKASCPAVALEVAFTWIDEKHAAGLLLCLGISVPASIFGRFVLKGRGADLCHLYWA